MGQVPELTSAGRRSARQAIIGLGSLTVILVLVVLVALSSSRRGGLRADVLSPRRAEPAEAITITVSARDASGCVRAVVVDFGDGTDPENVRGDGSCPPGPSTRLFDFDHAYATTGVYTVEAEVTSGGTGTSSERAEAIRTIEVKPVRR